jgi:hypothetical protein
MARVTETRGSDAPGLVPDREPFDECEGCTHERSVHNHPDAGQCTEIVDWFRRREPETCPCDRFVEPEAVASPHDDEGRFERPVVWLHDLFGPITYRWLQKNVLMRNDEHGIEITYRYRKPTDVICGATTTKPGDPEGRPPPWWFPVDTREPYDVGCTIVGDHRDAPHIGVPLGCALQTCDCSKNGSYHMVITAVAIGKPTPEHERPSSSLSGRGG